MKENKMQRHLAASFREVTIDSFDANDHVLYKVILLLKILLASSNLSGTTQPASWRHERHRLQLEYLRIIFHLTVR